jgi:hypothetical protein
MERTEEPPPPTGSLPVDLCHPKETPLESVGSSANRHPCAANPNITLPMSKIGGGKSTRRAWGTNFPRTDAYSLPHGSKILLWTSR